jgi:UDP-N-acetylmuramate: L-alanyl-gamma-D-glutamyl-meso-diaminopimelate ligase
LEYFDADMQAAWHAQNSLPDCSEFDLVCDGDMVGRVKWELIGRHNLANALAALAAARHAGVPPRVAIQALSNFKNVKRRMELCGEVNGVRVYDDFAHHPTAIKTTLEGLRKQVNGARIIAILEPRSNTMKRGVHADQLAEALRSADYIYLHTSPELEWDAEQALAPLGEKARLLNDTQAIVDRLVNMARPGDHLLVMSNGGFEGIHQRLLDALQSLVLCNV